MENFDSIKKTIQILKADKDGAIKEFVLTGDYWEEFKYVHIGDVIDLSQNLGSTILIVENIHNKFNFIDDERDEYGEIESMEKIIYVN